MDNAQEIARLKEIVAAQAMEIENLKSAMDDAKVLIDAFEGVIMELSTSVTFAHQKVNYLIDQDLAVASDLEALQDIVGTFGTPTPNAPPHS